MHIAYEIHIELDDLKPVIYRDFLVEPDISLPSLHHLIQTAFDWEDMHLHGFALPLHEESFYRVPADRCYNPVLPFDGDEAEPTQDEEDFTLKDLLQTPKSKLLYMYDFGDDWGHTLTLRKIVETDLPLPYLLKAEHGSPPEDCGGAFSYLHLSEAWHDKKHPDHAEAKDILGRQTPGLLNLEKLQKAIQSLQPRTSDKAGVAGMSNKTK
ncbi:MAG: plasmid pRiA4b ORF-3 family protein [Rhodoferax sp.]|nr:plasmid pRiA4b ORF-3 family protein [Rhodoferax sp.]